MDKEIIAILFASTLTAVFGVIAYFYQRGQRLQDESKAALAAERDKAKEELEKARAKVLEDLLEATRTNTNAMNTFNAKLEVFHTDMKHMTDKLAPLPRMQQGLAMLFERTAHLAKDKP